MNTIDELTLALDYDHLATVDMWRTSGKIVVKRLVDVYKHQMFDGNPDYVVAVKRETSDLFDHYPRVTSVKQYGYTHEDFACSQYADLLKF